MRKLSVDELNRLSVEEYAQNNNANLVIVLDNIRSMHNIGSAFRTADAFGVNRLFLCGITASPPHREIQKTALGATESVNWIYTKETKEALELLKSENFVIVAVEQTDKSQHLQNFELLPDQKYAFVFGNEVYGISQETVEAADKSVEIPQFGTKHSFNVSVTIGIVLWHYHYKVFLV